MHQLQHSKMMATRGATSPPLPLLRCSPLVPRTAAVSTQRRRAAAPLRTKSSASNSSSSSSSSATSTTGTAFDIAERMRWLEQDLSHLFDDTGVDPKGYDDKVEFLDPITRYDSVQGYLFNIKFLRAAFTPEFTLHDMRATGPYEVTTRWTMAMRFAPARALKIDKWWDPEITFTGTSAYGFNPANGRINRHIDTWDSVANQKFFSLEAFGDFLRQLTSTATAPKGLETPDYVLLRRAARYQVRRYKPFVIAVAPLDGVDESSSASDNGASSDSGSSGSGSSSGVNPASKGVRAFRDLAGYLFGGNADGRKMRMTAPVLSSTDGTMAFVIGRSDAESAAAAPAPAPGARVAVQTAPGGDFAAQIFTGVATPRRCAELASELRAALRADGLRPRGEGYVLARYNDPGTAPRRRRNEILIELEPGSFDLWRP